MAQDDDEQRRGRRSYFPAARNLSREDASIAALNRARGIHDFGYDRDFATQQKAIAASVAKFGANPATQTVQLPSGGTATIPITSTIPTQYADNRRMDLQSAFNLGFTGQPSVPAAGASAFERNRFTGFTGGREGGGVVMPSATTNPALTGFTQFAARNLGRIGTLGYNAFTSLFGGGRGAGIPAQIGGAPTTGFQPPPQVSGSLLGGEYNNQPRRYTDYF